MYISLYVITVLIANIITASMHPIHVGNFIVPAGTFLIGLTIIFRNFVQRSYGKHTAYICIGVALIFSAISSIMLGDLLWITIASAISFIVSESTETEIFSRSRLPFISKALYSGVVAGLLDSTLFVIIGLSPLGAGFLPWELVPYAIAGQMIVKTAIQFLCVNKLIVKGA